MRGGFDSGNVTSYAQGDELIRTNSCISSEFTQTKFTKAGLVYFICISSEFHLNFTNSCPPSSNSSKTMLGEQLQMSPLLYFILNQTKFTSGLGFADRHLLQDLDDVRGLRVLQLPP